MKQWVHDDVWDQLDRHAGALSRGQRNRLLAATLTAAVALGAGFAVDRSGVVRARLALAADAGYEASVSLDPKILTRQIVVRNTGWTTIRVVGVGQDGPGLKLLGPADAGGPTKYSDIQGTQPPFDLHPGETATLVVVYRVTDCAAVPAGPFPVPVRVDRPWGTQTIRVSLPPTYEGPDGYAVDPPMTEWQKAMADQACGVRK